MKIVWECMCREFNMARQQFKQQYDFAPKGATVDLREPLKRSTSAQDVQSSTPHSNT
jgi:hypothetical protein